MIEKSALIVFRNVSGQKELMFVAPKNKSYLVFPGGKIEPGESAKEALQREITEELDSNVKEMKKIGEVTGNTPDGRVLKMNLYSAKLAGKPKPSSEIESIIWLSKSQILEMKDQMTPITPDHVMPFLENAGSW